MTQLPIALFNLENGGKVGPGTYDFTGLKTTFGELDEAPGLIILCEAKEYGYCGSRGLFEAETTLQALFGAPYVGLLGWIPRGDHGPAVFCDANQIQRVSWADTRHLADFGRNVGHFRLRATGAEFIVIPQHWSFRSGDERLYEAEFLATFGSRERLPVIVAGDLNTTASGLHLPQRDWATMEPVLRGQKGRELPDGRWVADTRSLDRLIGRFDEASGGRNGGCGFYALAELAEQTGTSAERAFLPTTNEGGSRLLIDWILVNQPQLYVPGSYRVHVPAALAELTSDHRLISAKLQF